MSIIRAPRPEAQYLTIRNEVVRDTRLKLRALGLLVRILSRPDNWATSAEQLSAECVEGRDAVATALRELREAGYMRQERKQDARTGLWTTDTYVYDLPLAARAEQPEQPSLITDDQPDTVSQGSDDQGSDNQRSVSQGVSRKTEKNNQEREELKGRSEVLFGEFWRVYPKRIAKATARKRWDRLVLNEGVDPATIVRGAEVYARACRGSELRFVAHAATWLNANRWEDEVVVEADQRREPQMVFTESEAPEPDWGEG